LLLLLLFFKSLLVQRKTLPASLYFSVFSLHHLHAARRMPPLLGSFHTFSLPPSLFFSLHRLDSSQAQPHSNIASPSDRTYSRVHTHSFTWPSLLTPTASSRLRFSESVAQCCVFLSFRFANLGALDLALVGCEHGFPSDLGLETMIGLCCLVLFSDDCIADWGCWVGTCSPCSCCVTLFTIRSCPGYKF
jgi:hypothetical protein